MLENSVLHSFNKGVVPHRLKEYADPARFENPLDLS
jgi:hypothetical protein